jgi:hypothetical protein
MNDLNRARRPWRQRLARAVSDFVSRPAAPLPLAVLRIGLAVVLLGQAAALSGSLLDLYGDRGLTQWAITDRLLPPGVPRLGWLADALAPLGLSAGGVARGVFLAYVAGLAGLLLGWRTRPSAVLAWLTHLMLGASGATSVYGVDQWATVALFYCIWLPVGSALSLDAGGGPAAATAGARLGLRVLQLHLCLAYLASGLEKASGEQWRDGEAVWRAVMRPDLAQFDLGWLASASWLAVGACWGTLAVEIGYAILVWPRRTRKAMALATLGMHAGIAVCMGLWSFSALMMVLTIAAFLVPAEPRPAAAADSSSGAEATAETLPRDEVAVHPCRSLDG